jgi:poly-gamma-glutamate capsule biosynthesis protein CapA/YwtB (metallophosphatase superfamily)
MSTINVIVGGDIVPQGRNLPHFEAGETSVLFNDLQTEFERADISIVNLECPLIKKSNPISKTGPVLGADSKCIAALRFIDVVNLANNHIMDHGKDGLENTLSLCAREKISYVGAGKNLDYARRILIKEAKDIRIGILSVTEHEFSTASKDGYGANPLDILDCVRNIKEHNDKWDYLIVLLHGGNEHYPYPSPRLRDTCRFLVEEGACAVICQQSHCPGCYETYQNKHIVYGQGNLIFDRFPCQIKDWDKGFLVRLEIEKDCSSTMSFVPYRQSDSDIGARKMGFSQTKAFLRELQKRSDEILDDGFVEAKWDEFCDEKCDAYLRLLLLPQNRIMGYLNRKYHLCNKFLSKRKRNLLLTLMRCESHREILERIL